MDDIAGGGTGRTPRMCEMGCQTNLTLADVKQMEVNSFVVRDHLSKMKEKVDSIKKKELKPATPIKVKVMPPKEQSQSLKKEQVQLQSHS